jgi:hypothetical protein
MRPWKLASEAITLDILSHGRIILSVGLGAIDTGFEELGEKTDLKTRAELLDESLDIIEGLWDGDMSDYSGRHYVIKKLFESEFFKRHPPPKLVQTPRIPIWVVGAWPYKKSMKRTLKYDGIIPTIKNSKGEFQEISPNHIIEINSYIQENYVCKTFDIIVEGTTPGDDPQAVKSIIRPFIDAGATWWIESDWATTDLEVLIKRVKQGPPNF